MTIGATYLATGFTLGLAPSSEYACIIVGMKAAVVGLESEHRAARTEPVHPQINPTLEARRSLLWPQNANLRCAACRARPSTERGRRDWELPTRCCCCRRRRGNLPTKRGPRHRPARGPHRRPPLYEAHGRSAGARLCRGRRHENRCRWRSQEQSMQRSPPMAADARSSRPPAHISPLPHAAPPPFAGAPCPDACASSPSLLACGSGHRPMDR